MDLTYQYAEAAVKKTLELLAIDSPTGYTAKAADFVKKEFEALGFAAHLTTKGGVLIDLGGCRESLDGDLLLEAHTDTLGGMVAEIKGNGRLRLTALGGMQAENGEAENVRIYTRGGSVYEGTLQLCNASVHVNKNYSSEKRSFDTTEVVIDEDVRSDSDTRALGIEVGDMVCFDPRSRVTASGYIKSRFLDDKLSVGILWGFARYLADHAVTLPRRTYIHITVYEEVGHGGAASVPAGVTEAISVDMGCVGDGLQCTEKQVSICAKDSGGPYSYDVVGKLIAAAKKEEADYAIDVYPHYGSDVEATLGGGFDLRHGLIGAGVYASHGYERSHTDGVYNTLKVLKGYLNI
ncbi:MAG: M42 family metallopeptidase [Clostridia bacterium]|nr:M42 family metallopeptidase [Clostridia bacterium]